MVAWLLGAVVSKLMIDHQKIRNRRLVGVALRKSTRQGKEPFTVVEDTKVRKERWLTKILAHLFRGNLMGRTRTLQEGALSRDCSAQLVDTVIQLSHMGYRRF